MLKSFSRHRQQNTVRAIRATTSGLEQSVKFEKSVLDYLHKHRQSSILSNEAGGQLFGSLGKGEAHIVLATGPYLGDERSRYNYRSNPIAAQREIEKQAKSGLFYFGEWHTHPEDFPRASDQDIDAIRKLLQNSTLNLNMLFMLIIGRSSDIKGFDLTSIMHAEFDQWELSEST